MTLSERERSLLVKNRVEKARDTIHDVSFLIENGKLPLAVNRIYYGAFYILSALALQYQFTTSKHQQLIGWFNRDFIKKGLLGKEYGEFIHKAYDKRSRGDYDDFVKFEKAEVNELFAAMKRFVNTVENLILSNTIPTKNTRR